jgi:hypothetical protein
MGLMIDVDITEAQMATRWHSRNLGELIEHYMDSRKGTQSPISTAAAARAIRTVIHDCPASSRILADMIARAAVARGHNVEFDLYEKGSGPVDGSCELHTATPAETKPHHLEWRPASNF